MYSLDISPSSSFISEKEYLEDFNDYISSLDSADMTIRRYNELL